MDQITLADGTVVLNTYVTPRNGMLFIYVQEGMTMLEVCTLMSDPAKTARITYNGSVYEGYTDLFILQKTGSQIGCGLSK